MPQRAVLRDTCWSPPSPTWRGPRAHAEPTITRRPPQANPLSKLSNPEKLHALPHIDRPARPVRHLTLSVPGEPFGIAVADRTRDGWWRQRRIEACCLQFIHRQPVLGHLGLDPANRLRPLISFCHCYRRRCRCRHPGAAGAPCSLSRSSFAVWRLVTGFVPPSTTVTQLVA